MPHPRDLVERGTEPRTCKDPIGQHEGEADPREIAVANGLSATLPFTDYVRVARTGVTATRF